MPVRAQEGVQVGGQHLQAGGAGAKRVSVGGQRCVQAHSCTPRLCQTVAMVQAVGGVGCCYAACAKEEVAGQSGVPLPEQLPARCRRCCQHAQSRLCRVCRSKTLMLAPSAARQAAKGGRAQARNSCARSRRCAVPACRWAPRDAQRMLAARRRAGEAGSGAKSKPPAVACVCVW